MRATYNNLEKTKIFLDNLFENQMVFCKTKNTLLVVLLLWQQQLYLNFKFCWLNWLSIEMNTVGIRKPTIQKPETFKRPDVFDFRFLNEKSPVFK